MTRNNKTTTTAKPEPANQVKLHPILHDINRSRVALHAVPFIEPETRTTFVKDAALALENELQVASSKIEALEKAVRLVLAINDKPEAQAPEFQINLDPKAQEQLRASIGEAQPRARKQTRRPSPMRFNGSSLQGYIECAYADLVRYFGEPNSKGDAYKVDAEWELEIDGTLATIYNYKDGINYNGAGGTPVEQIVFWHIGGFSQKAVEAVRCKMGVAFADKVHGR